MTFWNSPGITWTAPSSHDHVTGFRSRFVDCCSCTTISAMVQWSQNQVNNLVWCRLIRAFQRQTVPTNLRSPFIIYLELTLKTCLAILRIEFTILPELLQQLRSMGRQVVDVTCVASSIPLILRIGRKPNLFTPSLSTQQILEEKKGKS